MLKFSIFLGYGRIGPPESYTTNLFEENLREAVEAERLGFDMVWVPEHHLIHYMQCPSALLLATHVGMHTRFRIGTMVTLILYRHPLVTAGEVATADHLLGGRLEFGVGRGAYEYEFERMGVPFAEARARFSEKLAILEEIWHSPGQAVTFDGRYDAFDTSYVWPRPLQQPHPPVWLAAMTDPTIEWAAKKGYHVANWPFSSPMSRVATVSRVFHESRQEIGHDGTPQRLGILRGAFAVENRRQLDRYRELALHSHRIAHRLHFFTQNSDPRGVVSPDPVEGEPDPAHIFDNLVVGTPEECLENVEEYDYLGVDEPILAFNNGAPHEEVLDSMRIFAEGVIRPYRAKRERQPDAARDGWRTAEMARVAAGGFGHDERELRAGRME
jgi:alkanesulfonate monooxygenase SsuD/methylene tetrahydromethanopterin reductase-like flavin-dependent oxidoreductase (luciferase family)